MLVHALGIDVYEFVIKLLLFWWIFDKKGSQMENVDFGELEWNGDVVLKWYSRNSVLVHKFESCWSLWRKLGFEQKRCFNHLLKNKWFWEIFGSCYGMIEIGIFLYYMIGLSVRKAYPKTKSKSD